MATTLWEVLGSIADRRGRKGWQFVLQAILAIAIAAMLAGADDLRAIFRWGRQLKPEALALLGIERAPCHATYHYVFQSLDGNALAMALGLFAAGGGAPGHIAIDGKTLHVLSAFATGLSAVIGDIVVEPGQNGRIALRPSPSSRDAFFEWPWLSRRSCGAGKLKMPFFEVIAMTASAALRMIQAAQEQHEVQNALRFPEKLRFID